MLANLAAVCMLFLFPIPERADRASLAADRQEPPDAASARSSDTKIDREARKRGKPSDPSARGLPADRSDAAGADDAGGDGGIAGGLDPCPLALTTVDDADWLIATGHNAFLGDHCVECPSPGGMQAGAVFENVAAPCYGRVKYWKFASGGRTGGAVPMGLTNWPDMMGVTSMFVRDGVRVRLFRFSNPSTTYDIVGPRSVASLRTNGSAPPLCQALPANTLIFEEPGWGSLSDFGVWVQPPLVLGVDPLVPVNHAAHRTDQVDVPTGWLFVRRGQPFDLDVEVSREFDPSCCKLGLRMSQNFEGPVHEFDVDCNTCPWPHHLWTSEIVSTAETASGTKILRMRVHPPASDAVGSYRMVSMRVLASGVNPAEPVVSELPLELRVAVLFNPWESWDTTYLADPAARDEYVLRETGRMWREGGGQMNDIGWHYGQFDTASLDWTLQALNGLDTSGRRSPGFVARHLTRMINGYALEGRWDGQYDDGVEPWRWNSSTAIFAEALRVPTQRVRYGQCWVFAGVLTTSLRALGIPARPVTNFDSGHEKPDPQTNGFNGEIEWYVNEDGTYLQSGGSVWNYHVWCEIWHKRGTGGIADGPGWSAVDATPQERSVHFPFQWECGPAPVPSIKGGLYSFTYDVGFLISEVDADIVYFVRDAKGTWVERNIDSTMVGRAISTKAVGSADRVDITASYKEPEPPAGPPGGVPVSMSAPAVVDMGADLVWTVTVLNDTPQPLEATYAAAAMATSYNGDVSVTLGSRAGSSVIPPGESWTQPVTLPAAEWSKLVSDAATVTVTALVKFPASGAATVRRGSVPIRTGLVSVAIPPVLPKGAPVVAVITVENTTGAPLEDVVLSLRSHPDLRMDGESAVTLALGDLAPGASRVVKQQVVAVGSCEGYLSAVVEPSSGRWFSDFAEVRVPRPQGADLDGDGRVNGSDLAFLLAAWGTNDPTADLDGNGTVGGEDLAALLVAWTG